MFRNYLTVAIRNIARHKVYSFINIAGLAIGMACCALILLYVQHELSYDAFHAKGDRIYQMVRETRDEEGGIRFSKGISGPFAPALKANFPEVEHAVRVTHGLTRFVQSDNEQFYHPGSQTRAADPDFFRIFDFEFIRGDRDIALRDPYSVVIREDVAERYFGSEDPIGKVITFADGRFRGDHTVTGVVRVPDNSSIQFEMMCSLHAGMIKDGYLIFQWENWQPGSNRAWRVFVVLREGADLATLKSKLPDFMERYMGKKVREKNTYHLQPLHRIHLYAAIDYDRRVQQASLTRSDSDIQTVYLFSAIAGLIMLIACVNFINLATARSANRAREVGVRKVSGAYRFQLIRQFLGEAILLSFLSFVLALGLVELSLPEFSAFVSKDLMPAKNLYHVLAMPGLVAFVGLLAGIYPAFFLSAFEPIVVLKGQLRNSLKGAVLRRGLVTFQFAISILLIISTVMIYRQLNYIQNKNLGFQKSHLVTMPLFLFDAQKKRFEPEDWLTNQYSTVKEAFLAYPNVLNATAHRAKLGLNTARMTDIHTKTKEAFQAIIQPADEHFLDTCEIQLVAGQTLQQSYRAGGTEKVLLNETAVKMLGWENPIGKQLSWANSSNIKVDGTVVGVVKDFHNQSLHEEIKPLLIWNSSHSFTQLSVRIRGDELPKTLAFLEQTWKQFLPDRPFDFEFADESLNQFYSKYQEIGQLVSVFTLLAIVVACLGLFGLAAFTAEQRTKEIGVRKVMGAPVRSIVLLLSKEFAKQVLVANVIAWPVAYFAVGDWLQNFAYRVDLSWWVFALAGVTALLIALGTVGYQALRAALANPIEALRYE